MTSEGPPKQELGLVYYDSDLENVGLDSLRNAEFVTASTVYETMATDAVAAGDSRAAAEALDMSAYCLECHLRAYEGSLSREEVARVGRRHWFLTQRAQLVAGLENPGTMFIQSAWPELATEHKDLVGQAKDLESRAVVTAIDDALRRNTPVYYALRSQSERLSIDQIRIGSEDQEAINRTISLTYAQKAFEVILQSDPTAFSEYWQRESAIYSAVRQLYFGVLCRGADEREADRAVYLLGKLLQLHNPEYDSGYSENAVTKSYELVAGLHNVSTAQATVLRKTAIAGMVQMADRQANAGISAGTTTDLYSDVLRNLEDMEAQGDHDASKLARLLIAERPERDWANMILDISRRNPRGDVQMRSRAVAYSCELARVLTPADQREIYGTMLKDRRSATEVVAIVGYYLGAGGKLVALSQDVITSVAISAKELGNEALASDAANAVTDPGAMRSIARALVHKSTGS